MKRVAVLGLDGVPYSLLCELIGLGIMPNFKSLVDSGRFGPLETELPPVSSTAWTSFVTASNPGRHGIFGFTDFAPGTLQLKFPSFDDVRAPALWRVRPDARVLALNVPFTYPARALNGTLVAGFVAPVFERSVYPHTLIPYLKSVSYKIDVDAAKGRENRRGFMTELFETLALREQVFTRLIKTTPWDLLIAVITETDRLHHFFYGAHSRPDDPFGEDFLEFYRRLDGWIGRFVQDLPADTSLIMLSDHGFTDLIIQVNVNNILKRLGYLAYTTPQPQSTIHFHPSSRAFALDPSRVYLNRRNRFPNGLLTDDDAGAVRNRLANELEQLRPKDLGIEGPGADLPLFARVAPKEEIYQGHCIEFAPDLVLVPQKGYDLKASIGTPQTAWKDIFTGTHTHVDAFVLVAGSGTVSRMPDKISEAGELVLELL